MPSEVGSNSVTPLPADTTTEENNSSVAERRNAPRPLKLDLFKFKRRKQDEGGDDSTDRALPSFEPTPQHQQNTSNTEKVAPKMPKHSDSASLSTATSVKKTTTRHSGGNSDVRRHNHQRNNKDGSGGLPPGEYLLLLPDFMKNEDGKNNGEAAPAVRTPVSPTPPAYSPTDRSAPDREAGGPSLVPQGDVCTKFGNAFTVQESNVPSSAPSQQQAQAVIASGSAAQPLSTTPEILRAQIARQQLRKSHLQSPSMHSLHGSTNAVTGGRSPVVAAVNYPPPPSMSLPQANSIVSERQAKRDAEVDPCCPAQLKCTVGAPTVMSTSTIAAGILRQITTAEDLQSNVCYAQQLEQFATGITGERDDAHQRPFPLSVDALRFVVNRMLLNFSSSLDKNLCAELLRRIEHKWASLKAGRFGCKVHRVIFQDPRHSHELAHHHQQQHQQSKLRRLGRRKRQEIMAAEQQLHALQGWSFVDIDVLTAEKEGHLLDMTTSAAVAQKQKGLQRNTGGDARTPLVGTVPEDGPAPPTLLMPPSVASGSSTTDASAASMRQTLAATPSGASTTKKGRRPRQASATPSALRATHLDSATTSTSNMFVGDFTTNRSGKSFELVDPTWRDIETSDACKLLQERWSAVEGAVGFIALPSAPAVLSSSSTGGAVRGANKLSAAKILSPAKLAMLLDRYLRHNRGAVSLRQPSMEGGGITTAGGVGVSPILATTDSNTEGMLSASTTHQRPSFGDGGGGSIGLASGRVGSATTFARPPSGVGSESEFPTSANTNALLPRLYIHDSIRTVLNPERGDHALRWTDAAAPVLKHLDGSSGVGGGHDGPSGGSKSDLNNFTTDDDGVASSSHLGDDGDVVKAVTKSWRRGKKLNNNKRRRNLLEPTIGRNSDGGAQQGLGRCSGESDQLVPADEEENEPEEDGDEDGDECLVEAPLLGMCKEGAYDLDELLMEAGVPFSPLLPAQQPKDEEVLLQQAGVASSRFSTSSTALVVQRARLEQQRKRGACTKNGGRVPDSERSLILPVWAAQAPLPHSKVSKIISEQLVAASTGSAANGPVVGAETTLVRPIPRRSA